MILPSGTHCYTILKTQRTKTGGQTVIGAARVEVVETIDADDEADVLYKVRITTKTTEKYLINTMFVAARHELYQVEDKTEYAAFGEVVNRYWGPGSRRNARVA